MRASAGASGRGRSRALALALLYALGAAAWILASDWLLGRWVRDPERLTVLAAVKGWAFVVFTAVLLYRALRAGEAPGSAEPAEGAPRLRRGPLALAALAIGVLTVVAVLADRQHQRAQRLEAIATASALRAQQLAGWMDLQLAQGRLVAGSGVSTQLYRRWVAGGEAAPLDDLLARAANLRQAFGHRAVALLRADGRVLAHEGGDLPPASVRASVASALAAAIADGRPRLVGAPAAATPNWIGLVAPLRDAAGATDAALLFDVDPAPYLLPTLSAWPVPSRTGTMALFQSDGDRFEQLPGDGQAALQPQALLAAKHVQGTLAAGVVGEGLDGAGVPVYGVVRPLPQPGWMLVATVGRDEIELEALANAPWIVAAGVLALAAAGIGAVRGRDQRMLQAVWQARVAERERLHALGLMQTIADGAGDAIFAKDNEGRYLMCNAEVSRVMGRPVEEVIGRDDRALFTPEVAAALRINDAAVRAEGVVRSFEEQVQVEGGPPRVFLATKGPLRDRDGQVIGMFGISRDITDRKQAEHRLREVSELLQAVKDSVLDHMAVLDRDGGIMQVNAAWQRFADTQGGGLRAGTGRNYLEVCRATQGDERAQAHAVADGIAAVLRGDADHFGLEYPCDSPTEARWFQMNVTPLRTAAGGAVVVHSDVTQRRRAEEALRTSAEQSRSMLSVLDEGILVFDTSLKLLACNPQAERFFGRPLAALQADGWLAECTPLRRDGTPMPADELPVARTARSGRRCRNVLVAVAFRGRRRWLVMHAEPVVDADGGEPTAVVTSFSDITERHEAEQQLRKLSLALAQSPIGIVIADTGGRVDYVNDAFVRISGIAALDAVGAELRALQPAREPASRVAEMGARVLAGESWSGEFRNRRRDGTPYDELVHAAPLREDERLTHCLLIVEDVTRHKQIGAELDRHRHRLQELVDERTRQLQQANAALLESRDRAESANRAKSAFLANMSHEIRTPMNAILGLTHLMRRDAQQPQQRERLDRVADAAGHLLEVINDILDLSKIEAGRLELEAADFSLAALLERTAALVAGRAQARGLTLALHHDGVPDGLHGDPMRLSQALLNLLTNAVKFTERGGIEVEVRLLAQDDDGVLLRFEVRDSGVGIAAEHLPLLFSAFVQADVSTTRRFGGTGLGLAITRRLAERMGGEVGVESTPGRGSLFWFSARLGRAAADAVLSTSPMPLPALAAEALPVDAESVLRGRSAGARVLLVEDHPVNQGVMQELLRAVGLQVELAADGRQALERIAASPPDLVLMDLQMPVMDGLEATRRLRALPLPQRLPVIAMTASAFGEDREACLAAGMDDHVAKPVDPPALYAALLRWLPARAGGPAPARMPAGRPAIDVPGLDAGLALGYLGGRAELYPRLLRQFSEHYRAELPRLAQAAEAGDAPAMRQFAHSLRSAAGAIGAQALRDDAQALERTAADGAAAAAAEAARALLPKAAQVLAAIDAALPVFEARDETGTAAPAVPPAAAALDRLAELLDRADYDALAAYQAVAAAVRACWPDGARQIEAALRRFDYDDALAVLRRVRRAG